MRTMLLLLLCLPFISFSQVSVNELTRNNGLTYQKNSTTPFTGKAFAYFPDGSVQMAMEYKNGILDGKLESWYKKDVKQMDGYVSNGKRAGTWKLWFENGKLKKQSEYKDDLEEGEEIFWFENGNMSKKGSYTKGKLNGKYEWFYENGQKKQEGYFIEGKEDGTWKDWHENGKQKMIGHFTDTKKSGEWIWWNEDGTVSTKKTYENGLVKASDFDTYLESMEHFVEQQNFKEALRNVELANQTITDKTENNPVYMGLAVFHSRCYSTFGHYREAEKLLLNVIGLTNAQVKVIQESHTYTSPEKINALMSGLRTRNTIGSHIALAYCYNILSDTVNLQKEQQLMMDKGGSKDWIITISMELYKLGTFRFNSYYGLKDIDERIKKEGLTKELELIRARYLMLNQDFAGATAIADKYLQKDEKNLTAILLKVDLAKAAGDMAALEMYEKKALAIDSKSIKR